LKETILNISKADPQNSEGWQFDNSYARLPESLYSRVHPISVADPRLVILNEKLSVELGLDAGALMERSDLFAGNRVPAGADPIAQAYAGHQFGHFTNLGDGRAILLGEHLTPQGRRFDIQLKGSGATPYSRRGDGRAALGPMLREYVISEAMHALGIPTTRSLAVATTGEQIYREEMLPGAVLTRVASSHIRVGTFEYANALGDRAALEALTEHTLQRHYPDLLGAENKALALLGGVIERQAELIAQWLCVGFVHGVMNTDNMALSGETIDFGPCAFLDSYHSETVFSSIDRGGRYAYGNQPNIAHWNLARLAEALLPLIDKHQEKAVATAEEVLSKFPKEFRKHHEAGLRAKLGLISVEEGDKDLADQLLEVMQTSGADFTSTFVALTKSVATGQVASAHLNINPMFKEWHGRWTARLERQNHTKEEVVALMRRANPVIIPRNHRVEEALVAAQTGDLNVLRRLLEVLANPFEETEENEPYRSAPLPGGIPYKTFCGT
jgi:serine/tyrosine/threonine adenylyltransferase